MHSPTRHDEAPAAPPEDRVSSPRDLDAARLRDASPVERVARVVLAALVVGFSVLATYERLTGPREVRDLSGPTASYELLADAAEGRLERVDLRNGAPVRWRTRGGGMYEFDRRSDGDVRARIEAQPYVRDNPGSVTYGPIRVSRLASSPALTGIAAVGGLVLLSLLYRGPRPRLASRWAWFWVLSTGIGTVAYLLLAGSWGRTEPRGHPRKAARPRLGGTAAFVAVAIVVTAWTLAANAYYDDRHPLGTSDRVVPSATPGA